MNQKLNEHRAKNAELIASLAKSLNQLFDEKPLIVILDSIGIFLGISLASTQLSDDEIQTFIKLLNRLILETIPDMREFDQHHKGKE